MVYEYNIKKGKENTLTDMTITIASNDIKDNKLFINIPSQIDGTEIKNIGCAQQHLITLKESEPNVFSLIKEISVNIEKGIKAIYNLMIETPSKQKYELSVNLASTIEQIYRCRGRIIKNINFKEATSLVYINESAFKKCVFLNEIEFPASLISIKGYSFADCSFMKNVNFEKANISFIGINAFSNSQFLSNETIKFSNIGTISSCAFSGTNIKKVCLSSDRSDVFIGSEAFSNSKITSFKFEASNDCKLSLMPSAFANCSFLEDVSILNCRIEKLGKDCFFNDISLKNLNLSNYSIIDEGCFENCSLLSEIVIPPSCLSINHKAFYNSGLRKISFKDDNNIQVIENLAFAICKLEEIPSNIIECCEYVGDNIFSGNCFKTLHLKAFGSPKKISPLNMFSSNKDLQEVYLENGKYDWTKIFPAMFSGCENLAKIKIPDTVYILRAKCFANTGFGVFEANQFITTIKEGVFNDCKNLTLLDLSKVEKLCEFPPAVLNSPKLSSIIFPTFYDKPINVKVSSSCKVFAPFSTKKKVTIV